MTRLILVASTPRVGSTLLAEQLRQAGLGVGREYFNPFNDIKPGAKELGASNYIEYWKAIKETKSAGGAIVVKAHFEHFAFFLNKVNILNDPDIESVHYIRLRRRDLAKQAISYLLAKYSEKWHSTQSEQKDANEIFNLPEAHIAAFVRIYMINLHIRDVLWSEYFEYWGVEPFEIYYEDLVRGMTLPGACVGASEDIVLQPESTQFTATSGAINKKIYEIFSELKGDASLVNSPAVYKNSMGMLIPFFESNFDLFDRADQ